MDLNVRAFKGPDSGNGWPVSSSQVAAAINALQPAVAQDNSAALVKPAKQHVVTGWTFSVDQATSVKGVLQLVEDPAGSPIFHEQIEIPVGFTGRLRVDYHKPIEARGGAAIALVTTGSLGAGVKATGALRGYSVRAMGEVLASAGLSGADFFGPRYFGNRYFGARYFG